jgi:2,4-dienoyl-CoA reductase (NADPH2)
VVWAIGARPAQTAVWRLRPWLRDGIPGSAGLRHGRDVLAGGAMPSGRVLVVDEEGGWPAVSLAETLAAASGIDTVTVATTESRLGAQALAITFEFGAVQARLAAAGVEVLPETTVARIDGPWAELPDGRRIGPYDEILLSTGVAAAEPPEDALAVGDCVAPRGLWAAVNEAARLAREL